MAFRVDLELSADSSFEVELLERLRPRGEYTKALAFPGSAPVDPQQELAAAPVVGVRPIDADPWIGVFYGGGYPNPEKVAQIFTGPEKGSLRVVFGGAACIVKAAEPSFWQKVDDVFPVRSTLAVPEHELVLFHSFTDVVAHGPTGKVWISKRLVWDDLELLGYEGDDLRAAGFDAPANRQREFTIDLRTGTPTGHPGPPF